MTSVSELVADARTHIDNLSPAQVRDELASDHVVLIDVREPPEWEEHIEGAVQVPRGLLEYVADPETRAHVPPAMQANLEPGTRVITYCRSGARGALAAYTLKSFGYERAANLDGGIAAWKKSNLPTNEHHGDLP